MKTSFHKLLTVAIALACISVTTSAATYIPHLGSGPAPSQLDLKACYKNDAKARTNMHNMVKRNTALRNVASPTGNETLITDPEGTLEVKSKRGYKYGWDYELGLVYSDFYGEIVKIYNPNNGKVYISSPITTAGSTSYIEGTLKDGVVTLEFPQLVVHENWGEDYMEYCMALKYDEKEESFVVSENQTYKFNIEEDGTWVSEDSDILLGNCTYSKDKGYEWIMAGDYLGGYAPIEEKLNVAPENAVWEDWNYVQGSRGFNINVAIDGNNFYIKNLVDINGEGHDAILKGTLQNDNTVIFADKQYCGISFVFCTEIWFRAANFKYNKEIESYDLLETDGLVMKYDPEAKSLMPVAEDHGYVITSCKDYFAYYYYCNDFAFVKNDPDAKISKLYAPKVTSYSNAQPEWEQPAQITFELPKVDKEYHFLDTSKMYYNIIMDGEVFTFYPDQYEAFENEMTDIPYDFSDGKDIDGFGYIRIVNILSSGFETLGVRLVYKDGENVVYSEIAYAPGLSHISQLDTDDIVSVRYYDLQGRELNDSAEGLMIRTTIDRNGNVKAEKIIK